MSFTQKSGLKIYFETAGDPNKPALLMNHGLGNSVANWHQLGYVDKLSPHFYLIMYDGRGFGKSDKPYESLSYKPNLLLDDCIAVLDELNIEKCHFFGNSRGGSLGFIAAESHSNSFTSFIIGGANPYGGDFALSFIAQH